jgi:NTE family protein
VEAKATDELQIDVDGKTNAYSKFSASYEKRFPIQEKLTLTFNANSSFIFQDAVDSDEVSFQDYGFGSKYFLGGNLISPREGSIVFPGLRENQLAVNQFIKMHLSFQYSPTNNVFIRPHINYATVGFGAFENYVKDIFLPDGRWTERIDTSSLFSAGTTLSYNSLLGPVNFDVSWVNDINKLRLFFSFGLFLNVSE